MGYRGTLPTILHRVTALLRLCLPFAILAATWSPTAAQPAPGTQETKHILTPPPLRWDRQMLSGRPALSQTITDFAAITTGITFGLDPSAVNAKLPAPAPGVAWGSLPAAGEFQDDIRYFWVRLEGLTDLHAGATACLGVDSYIVFLFQQRGLFRMSYRLAPDATCPNVNDAAEEIFGRYVSIATDIAQSVHYRAGSLEIVDISDPTASGYLVATRWHPRVE